jgi:hypothetical protein
MGGHPQLVGMVEKKVADLVFRQRIGIVGLGTEDGEGIPVETVQAVHGGNPQESILVLDDGSHAVFGQALSLRVVGEADITALSGKEPAWA